MADTKITIDQSSSQIRHSNPATHPLPASAGQPITVTKGITSVSVHGQITNSGLSIVFDNPGQ